MKKSETLLFWMIILYISIPFILSVTIWGYINLKVDDVVFIVVLFLAFVGYLGTILLYKDYSWAK